MTEHTKEPWEESYPLLWQAKKRWDGNLAVVSADDDVLPLIGQSDLLERAVACVNACAGIPTEALEGGALRDVLKEQGEPWTKHDPVNPETWPRKGQPVYVTDGIVVAIRTKDRHWHEARWDGAPGLICEAGENWTHWKLLVLPEPVEKPGQAQ